MDDCDDLISDGTLSIYEIAAYPRLPVTDPRHLSAEMRNDLYEMAIAELECRQAQNRRMLAELDARRSAI